MDVLILLVVFLIGLVIGIPIAVTLGLASFAYILVSGIPVVVIPQKMYAGIDVFVLLSIPGFILAGNLMNSGGITSRVIRFSNALVGWIRGGLGLTNVAASMLFGGITGTAVADAASIGGVMIPGMKKAGYPASFFGGSYGSIFYCRSDYPAKRTDDYRRIIVGDFCWEDVYSRGCPRCLDGACHDGHSLCYCS